MDDHEGERALSALLERFISGRGIGTWNDRLVGVQLRVRVLEVLGVAFALAAGVESWGLGVLATEPPRMSVVRHGVVMHVRAVPNPFERAGVITVLLLVALSVALFWSSGRRGLFRATAVPALAACSAGALVQYIRVITYPHAWHLLPWALGTLVLALLIALTAGHGAVRGFASVLAPASAVFAGLVVDRFVFYVGTPGRRPSPFPYASSVPEFVGGVVGLLIFALLVRVTWPTVLRFLALGVVAYPLYLLGFTILTAPSWHRLRLDIDGNEFPVRMVMIAVGLAVALLTTAGRDTPPGSWTAQSSA